VKRIVDIISAGAGLILGAPLLAVVALAVRLTMGTPVLFRHPRAGQHGSPIMVLKVRTMTDARGPGGELLADRERLSPFGRVLRSTSLDELPQLWAVLRGEMSLVGPRPLPLAYVSRYSPDQRRRLDVKPGLTGWAQVNGRNALTWPDKLALDVWYVEHQTIWLDFKIIAMTVRSLFTRRGVSAEGHATMPEFRGET
jgi:lipopolysaccharide/colanic/teichoic acid biosynthesis glycosyltransferase